jgi:probable rRNA maturation factor
MRLKVFKDIPTRTPAAKLKALFDVVVTGERWDHRKADINLVFTDDDGIRDLNREFRKKDRHTDVLSFVLDEPGDTDDTYGEIYISVPTARRQADEYGTTVTQEYLRLFGHGLLHLFGNEHAGEEEAEKMTKLEQRYLDMVTKGKS